MNQKISPRAIEVAREALDELAKAINEMPESEDYFERCGAIRKLMNFVSLAEKVSE